MSEQHILSKSRLDLINKAPQLYKRKYIDGFNEQTETPALILGKALHCRILEPSEFGKRYTFAPAIDKRTKEGKELYAQFTESAAGLTVLTQEQGETMERMCSAVFAHPAAKHLLGLHGVSETMLNWHDSLSGVPCRGIIDRLTNEGLIIDLKTTDDASPKGFARSCHKYRYHVQAAFYSDGYKQANNVDCSGFFFIAVEKSEPHLVAVYYLNDHDMQRGRDMYAQDIAKFIECEATNDWQGYGDNIQELTLYTNGK